MPPGGGRTRVVTSSQWAPPSAGWDAGHSSTQAAASPPGAALVWGRTGRGSWRARARPRPRACGSLSGASGSPRGRGGSRTRDEPAPPPELGRRVLLGPLRRGLTSPARAELGAPKGWALCRCRSRSRPCGSAPRVWVLPPRQWSVWVHARGDAVVPARGPRSAPGPPLPGSLKRRRAVLRAAGAVAAPALPCPVGPGPFRPARGQRASERTPWAGPAPPAAPVCARAVSPGRWLWETGPRPVRAPSSCLRPGSTGLASPEPSHPALVPSLPAPPRHVHRWPGALPELTGTRSSPSSPKGHHLARRRGQGHADSPAAVRLRGRGPHQARPLPGRHGRAALHRVQR